MCTAAPLSLPITDCPVCPQSAESTNAELESKSKTMKCNVEESHRKHGNLVKELNTFLTILDGKIDELHGFRQGLAKLGMNK